MKNIPQRLRILLILLVIFFNIGCDQVSKAIVRKEIGYHENIYFLDKHFTLTRVENTGAFLSVGNDLPEALRIVLLSVLPSLALLFGIYYIIVNKNISKLFIIGACFVIGGGIGNLYDRILYGSVTDFLHIDFGIFQTGVFNLADMSVMAGVIIIFFQANKAKSEPRHPADADQGHEDMPNPEPKTQYQL